MKQIFSSFPLVLLAALVACTAEPAPTAEDSFVLSANLENTGSKMCLGSPTDNAYPILWQTGDIISVNGTTSSALSSTYNGKKVATFTVSGTQSAPYKVLYPGTTSANVITLPATQSYVAGSFDPAAAAAYGNATKTGSNYGVTLTSFCGLLRFGFTGTETLDKIVLRSQGSEKLYGSFTLAANGDGFTGAFTGGTAGDLTYNCHVTLSEEVTYFYVAIPAQNYASGLEAEIYSGGEYMTLKFSKLTDSDGDGKADSGDMKGTDLVAIPNRLFDPKRAVEVVDISSLTAESGGNPSVTPPSIVVATYNVMRLDDDNRPAAATTGDSNGRLARPANAIVKSNTDMRAALGLAIYNTNADIVGFNEIGDDMYKSGQSQSLQDIVAGQGAAYTWKLDYPGSNSGNYHYCNGFAYKSAVLTLNSSGRAWLHPNSTGYSTSSDSNSGDPNRYVVWAKFTHKTSGKSSSMCRVT